MTKAELIHSIYDNFEGEITKRVAADMVEVLFEQIVGELKRNQRFTFPGFGTFVVRKRKARKGRNPRTGEAIKVKASKSVAFKASRLLRAQM